MTSTWGTEFMSSPYWDAKNGRVKPGAPEEVKRALEKARQERRDYLERRMTELGWYGTK